MNVPDHICDALSWLYGSKWHDHGHGFYSGGNLSVSRSDSGKWSTSKYIGRPEDVWDATERIEYAIKVTEPWQWERSATGHWHGYGGTPEDAVSAGLYEKTEPVPWWWVIGTMRHEDSAPDVKSAMCAARTAYLTWMHGKLVETVRGEWK